MDLFLRVLAATFISYLLVNDAAAAPNEIKVFTDELASYGEHTLETHVNKASRTPLQVMPEYSYGIWHDWEFSLQLPAAFGQDASRLEGYRTELQYVAPHDKDAGFYWGVNFELARVERPGDASFWNIELIPILAYRMDRWHFVANPGIDQPAGKVAYRAFEKNYFGVEYYVDDQSRVLYFAWDGKVGKSDINVGIGRGLTDSSDRWVLKMIYEIAF